MTSIISTLDSTPPLKFKKSVSIPEGGHFLTVPKANDPELFDTFIQINRNFDIDYTILCIQHVHGQLPAWLQLSSFLGAYQAGKLLDFLISHASAPEKRKKLLDILKNVKNLKDSSILDRFTKELYAGQTNFECEIYINPFIVSINVNADVQDDFKMQMFLLSLMLPGLARYLNTLPISVKGHARVYVQHVDEILVETQDTETGRKIEKVLNPFQA